MAVWEWSLTAGNNASADGSINWAEGQLPSTVNNSARAMMSAVVAWVKDAGGYAVLGGSGDTFTLTLTQTMVTRAAGPIGFFATRTNTGAVTMNVDGTGASPLRAVSGTALVASQIISGAFYIISWNSATSEWIINGKFTHTLSDLPSQSNNTVVGNFTGGSAVPTATAIDTALAAASASILNAGLAVMPTATIKANYSGEANVGTSTITVTIATPGVVSWASHGLAASAPVYFTTTGALPTGLTYDKIYYVRSPNTNDFTLSLTPGGAAINTTGSQSGTHTAVAPATDPPIDMTAAALSRVLVNQPVSADTGTSDTIDFNDRFKLKTYSNTSTVAVTLPQATGDFASGVWIDIQNVNTGLVTITPTTSTIDGAATLILPAKFGVRVVSDGTNWQIAGMNALKGRILLNTLTASASATLSDTTSFTSAFDYYELLFDNMLPATNNAQLTLKVHSGGSYQSTTYLNQGVYSSGGTATGYSTPTTFISLDTGRTGNGGNGVTGSVIVYKPTGTSVKKTFIGNLSYHAAAIEQYNTSGFWNGGNGAVDGFQLAEASGNITSGTCKVYGYN